MIWYTSGRPRRRTTPTTEKNAADNASSSSSSDDEGERRDQGLKLAAVERTAAGIAAGQAQQDQATVTSSEILRPSKKAVRRCQVPDHDPLKVCGLP